MELRGGAEGSSSEAPRARTCSGFIPAMTRQTVELASVGHDPASHSHALVCGSSTFLLLLLPTQLRFLRERRCREFNLNDGRFRSSPASLFPLPTAPFLSECASPKPPASLNASRGCWFPSPSAPQPFLRSLCANQKARASLGIPQITKKRRSSRHATETRNRLFLLLSAGFTHICGQSSSCSQVQGNEYLSLPTCGDWTGWFPTPEEHNK